MQSIPKRSYFTRKRKKGRKDYPVDPNFNPSPFGNKTKDDWEFWADQEGLPDIYKKLRRRY